MDFSADVGFHRLDHVVALVGDRFQRRADDVLAGRAARQPRDNASCAHVPVRRAQSRERGNHIDAVAALDLLSEIVGVLGVGNEAQPVAEPLYDSSADKDAALQRVFDGLALFRGGNGREQSVTARHRLLSRVG